MIIRPRLNDYHGLLFTQEEVDFAIPFLDEDIPLYLDPFLLWKSPSQMDNSLHTTLTNCFNYLGQTYLKDEGKAIEMLKEISECDEVGLGNSKTKKGKKIGNDFANKILSTFKDIPQVNKNGFTHFETLQLLVENFSKDRVSDIAGNFIKSFLIDYTIQESKKLNIPLESTEIQYFDTKKLKIVTEKVELPVNPNTKTPILLTPKRWLRFVPWISFENYFSEYIATSQKVLEGSPISRVAILEYNRANYEQVQTYIERRQLEQKDCKNDPLFSQIPILSSKRKKNTILKLPTGKTDNADKAYEDNLCPLLASMLYPELDFAQPQSRTISGVLIRDLIFYNNISHPLLKEIYENFESKQLVFELKNVKDVNTTHINQLNRYLNEEFGNFGIIFARNKPPKKVFQNTINLWAGQRKCILILDDTDLEIMCQVYENKQRKPLDVINKKYREFIRACPS
ncbi:MAG TPA: hypothetical protein PKA32_00175 [Candidatus Gracilibacteria bacterium]|nr:hypothetical protein [Candidatus Gracilibacteria bacterium]